MLAVVAECDCITLLLCLASRFDPVHSASSARGAGRLATPTPIPEASLLRRTPSLPSKPQTDGSSRKRTEIDSGLVIDEKAGNRPLREWWPKYKRTWGALSPSSRVAYETAWRLRIEPAFGDVRVRRIKPSTIDEWIGQMIEEGKSRSVIVETLGGAAPNSQPSSARQGDSL